MKKITITKNKKFKLCTMKNLFIAFLFTLLPSVFFAQTTAFDKYEDNPAINTVIVNKKMFQLMGEMKMDPKDKNAQQYINLVKKLESLKVFTTESGKISKDMKSTVDNYLKSHPLDELMRVTEDGKAIKIFVKSGATTSSIKEMLMFIEGGGPKDSTVVMSLTGNFDLSELSVLTDKMSLPGGNAIKKASKK